MNELLQEHQNMSPFRTGFNLKRKIVRLPIHKIKICWNFARFENLSLVVNFWSLSGQRLVEQTRACISSINRFFLSREKVLAIFSLANLQAATLFESVNFKDSQRHFNY